MNKAGKILISFLFDKNTVCVAEDKWQRDENSRI
jgi:hypothetical protein